MDEQQVQAIAHEAVKLFWQTRDQQTERQSTAGRSDQGARSAVTGGAQMDGFIDLFAKIVKDTGAPASSIFLKRSVELPGFFRPSKKWDLLVVAGGQLYAALEAKSQIGPSFGNNFNNRTEEAIGSATDLWTAYRQGAFNKSAKPWLGYMMLLEDCPASRAPLRVAEPHFKVFSEFKSASYAQRYEFLLRKLVRERLYDGACFLTTESASGLAGGSYQQPAADLQLMGFIRSLIAHISANFKS